MSNLLNSPKEDHPAQHIYYRKVHFSDTDAAGVAHFTKLLNFVEEAEHDFLLSCGVSPFGPDHGWPRVSLSVDYTSPCRFGDEVAITLFDFSYGRTCLHYQFRAEVMQDGHPRTVFTGKMQVCYVRRNKDSTGEFSPAPIPHEIVKLWGGLLSP
ncbi:MAG: acyl-CoA thioesterase [Chthoniobacterales bacterium]|nr:acyl-CoA thioesterase [Chthoniobacterales bacterium]